MDHLSELLDAYRSGDVAAQRRLLEAVQPLLMGYVRTSMGEQLRSLEQSVDISQSLLLGFHLQIADGKAHFKDEAALKAYLRRMVKNKLANRARSAKAAKRGGGKQPVPLHGPLEDEASVPPPADPLTASMVWRVKETRERIEDEMSDEERFILEGRLLGRTDREIAADLGKTADAVRMAWKRSRERLVRRGILNSPKNAK